MATLQQLEAAIFQEEGGVNAAGYSLNNPGDLESKSGNLESFPSLGAGQNAVTQYIQNVSAGNNANYPDNPSLADFETIYTGGDPNASSNIGSILGIDPESTSLASIVGNSDLGGGNPSLSLQQQLQGTAYQEPTLAGGYGVNVSPSGQVTATGMGQTKTAQASSSTPSWIQQIENWFASAVPREVAILVGIVLIAGAVFGFKELGNTVVQGVKKGAEVSTI